MHLIKNKDNLEYLFHQPPMRRSINYVGTKCRIHHSTSENENEYEYEHNLNLNKTRFFLSFPNILFRIKKHLKPIGNTTFQVFFTNSELTQLYHPALPNVGCSFEVCTSKIYYDADPKQIIQDFWNSTFNDELNVAFSLYWLLNNNVLSNLNTWEDKTKNEPNWIPHDFVGLKSKYQKNWLEKLLN